VEKFLIPHLGRICLADLTSRRLNAGFAQIGTTTNRAGRPQSASCLQHLRTTLRAALNLAVREGIIVDNPARRIEIPAYRKPHPQVWTDGRVAEWESSGIRPAVAVWTADHLATFLEAVTGDRLFALWWLIALRGLRRGEAAGLRWCELDLDHAQLFIVRNRTTAGYQVIEGAPKSVTSTRGVALDRHTVAVYGSTAAANSHNAPSAWPPARSGMTPGTYSSVPTAPRSTPATSPSVSPNSSGRPMCPQFGSTTCATAPRPSPTKRAPISRPCRTCRPRQHRDHRRHVHQRAPVSPA